MYKLIIALSFFVFCAYGLINQNTYHKPKLFITYGFIICITSVFLIDITESLSDKRLEIISERSCDLIKNMIIVTLAALGGGLMSTGFVLSAQRKHNEENIILKNEIIKLKEYIAHTEAAIKECESSEDKTIKDAYRTEHVKSSVKLIRLEETMEKRSVL